jgi:riboflavin synthase
MFTGLIEEIGSVLEVRASASGRRIRIRAPGIAAQAVAGESIACNGVCLTIETPDAEAGTFAVSAVIETLRCTTAGRWRRGTELHLERALRADGRLGGHIVQGHVDGLGRVLVAGRRGAEVVLGIALPRGLCRYVVAKGSLAIEGVSLTVGRIRGARAEFYLIPETCARTRLARLRPGEPVNLEMDVLAKHMEALLQRPGTGRAAVSPEGEAW